MAIEMIKEGLSYLRSHPMFLVKAARNAARLEVSVPVDLLKWAIERRPRGKGPDRIDVDAAPPGFQIGLTVDLYGTKIDVGVHLEIDGLDVASDKLALALKLRDLSVKAPPQSPAAMLLGSLDLSKPTRLLTMMPPKHAAMLEARGDDTFVIDLLKMKQLGGNKAVRKALSLIADVLSVRSVRTEDDVAVVGLGVSLHGLPSVLGRLAAGGQH